MKKHGFVSTFLSVFALFTLILGVSLGVLIYKADKAFEKTVMSVKDDNEQKQEGESQSSILRILLLGTDSVGNNCDTLMLASIDFHEQKAYFLQIPRDCYINSPDFKGHKINSVFSACYLSALERGLDSKNAKMTAAREFSDFLCKSMNITIDHFVLTELPALEKIVDTLGPLRVRVPCDIKYDDDAQGLHIDLQKGLCELDGKSCCDFVRARSAYLSADYGRMDAQKLVFSALFAKLSGQNDIKTMLSCAKAIIENTTTDISARRALSLCLRTKDFDQENIFFCTLTGTNVVSGESYEVLNRLHAVGMINAFFLSDHDLDPSEFDKNGIFTNPENESIKAAYESKSIYKSGIYSVKSINSDGIDIK